MFHSNPFVCALLIPGSVQPNFGTEIHFVFIVRFPLHFYALRGLFYCFQFQQLVVEENGCWEDAPLRVEKRIHFMTQLKFVTTFRILYTSTLHSFHTQKQNIKNQQKIQFANVLRFSPFMPDKLPDNKIIKIREEHLIGLIIKCLKRKE